MGFCLLANASIAARWAQDVHGIDRVLIVDFDVHHGNGTQDIFYDDPSVLFFSAHQFPYYPGTGAATELGTEISEEAPSMCPSRPMWAMQATWPLFARFWLRWRGNFDPV